MPQHRRPMQLRSLRAAVAMASMFLLTAALASCGTGTAQRQSNGLVGANPQRGGAVTYGLEAETTDLCGISATLDISGIEKYNAIYDTLTKPSIKDGKLEYSPYLAKSVTHSPDYMTWTVDVRDGITFHDGSKLDGKVVYDNLKAYKEKSLLFLFVFMNLDMITQTGPMQVTLTTKKPWIALDAYLWGSGRVGIMSEQQLTGVDPKTGQPKIPAPNCNRTPIGTGPFQFKVFNQKNPTPAQIRTGIGNDWKSYESLALVRNPHYWRMAPDGKPYPYLDKIIFKPMPEATQKRFALQSGEINMALYDGAQDLRALEEFRIAGSANYVKTNKYSELAYTQTNDTKPPFNSLIFRKVLQYGINRGDINTIINQDLFQVADSPFAPGVTGYLKDPGWPKYDLAKGKALLKQYLDSPEGKKAFPTGKVSLTFDTTTDTGVIQLGQLLQQQAKALGIDVKLNPIEQVNLINKAIARDFQFMVFRNWPGGDPDVDYVWWHCGDTKAISPEDKKQFPNYTPSGGNPVNFMGFCDPAIDMALDDARSSSDPAFRQKAYESISRSFAKNAWAQFGWYATWAVGFGPKIHGVYGPDLPDGGKPFPGLATGHVLLGVWIEK